MIDEIIAYEGVITLEVECMTNLCECIEFQFHGESVQCKITHEHNIMQLLVDMNATKDTIY